MKISRIALFATHFTGIVIALFTLYSTGAAVLQWAKFSSTLNRVEHLLSNSSHAAHGVSWDGLFFSPYGFFLLFQLTCAVAYLFLFFKKEAGSWKPMVPLILLILSWSFLWFVLNQLPPVHH